MAGDSVTPGMSKKSVSSVERRISALERITTGMSKLRLIADTATGRNEFQVLAMRSRPVKPDDPVFQHAFRIETRPRESGYEFRVLDYLSSITDGTNGDAFAITGLAITKEPESGWMKAIDGMVVVEGSVNSDLEVSGLAVKEIELGDYAGEVEFNEQDPPEQIKVILLLGKLEEVGDTMTVKQVTITAQMITNGILNGIEVVVFIPAPSNPTDLL